jgi:hypothetical protein
MTFAIIQALPGYVVLDDTPNGEDRRVAVIGWRVSDDGREVCAVTPEGIYDSDAIVVSAAGAKDEAAKRVGKTVRGMDVCTAVLEYFKKHPEEAITARQIKDAFVDELPSGNGIGPACWTLRQRGLIELATAPGVRPQRYRVTWKGLEHDGHVSYLATPPKPKEAPAPSEEPRPTLASNADIASADEPACLAENIEAGDEPEHLKQASHETGADEEAISDEEDEVGVISRDDHNKDHDNTNEDAQADAEEDEGSDEGEQSLAAE